MKYYEGKKDIFEILSLRGSAGGNYTLKAKKPDSDKEHNTMKGKITLQWKK